MSQVKERPILFSAPMVRAILEGRKTVTRRAIKVQPHIDASGNFCVGSSNYGQDGYGKPVTKHFVNGCCPYGKPGDRLWVRESFWGCDLPGYGDQPCVVYDDEWHGKEYKPAEARPWARKFGRIPGVHMPREASRIILEITHASVQRLRDSDDLVLLDELGDMLEDCDSVAGREFSRIEHLQCAGAPLRMLPEMYGFLAWWDKTNGHGSFDSNPWVWVVEFKRVTP